jgi:hypothetical protein
VLLEETGVALELMSAGGEIGEVPG